MYLWKQQWINNCMVFLHHCSVKHSYFRVSPFTSVSEEKKRDQSCVIQAAGLLDTSSSNQEQLKWNLRAKTKTCPNELHLDAPWPQADQIRYKMLSMDMNYLQSPSLIPSTGLELQRTDRHPTVWISNTNSLETKNSPLYNNWHIQSYKRSWNENLNSSALKKKLSWSECEWMEQHLTPIELQISD